jgi:hypothetical protein
VHASGDRALLLVRTVEDEIVVTVDRRGRYSGLRAAAAVAMTSPPLVEDFSLS